MNIQVYKSHYIKGYDTKGRFASYYHQTNEALNLGVDSYLEIGVGSSLLSKIIGDRIPFYKIDIDEQLRPDIVATITNLPLKNNTFDAILSFQVLEHIPFELFAVSLREMKRVKRKYILISLPDRRPYFSFEIKLYPVIFKRLSFTLSSLIQKKHQFDGEHFWEIGKKGYALPNILDTIEECSLKVLRHYRVPEKPLHHFFLLTD